MKEKIQEFFHNLITSRVLVLGIVIATLAGVLIARLFTLQIVNGEYYQENFQLKIIRKRSIASTRGNIYDRNGNLLGYNELAYSIVIEDIFDDENNKNQAMNDVIMTLSDLLEKNGDSLISDFGIILNEDNQFEFAYTDTKHLRFLADIYGYATIDKLKYDERNATPEDVVDFFCAKKNFAIGSYHENPETGKKEFTPREGYSNEDILKLIIVRYNIGLNAFKKYVTTTVATDVSDETVVAVYENEDILKGVSVSKDTVRRYKDSVYFSQVLGYTGMISQEEYDQYYDPEHPDRYTMNDFVGKTGMELSMEQYLQGTKGEEVFYVNNTGKVLERVNYTAPVAGSDIYLTIDRDLQVAVYHLLEQKIAGILVSKIRNIKEFTLPDGASQSKIVIPIDDVYYQCFNNNVIDLKRLSKEYASDTEKEVYSAYLSKEEAVLQSVEEMLRNGTTPYNQLSKENQVYQSFIIAMLSSENHGIIVKGKGYEEDATYNAWAVEETISMKEYLEYCISKNWINTQNLDVTEKRYSDSDEIYDSIVRYTIEHLKNNTEFSKKIYKYMIAQNLINGRQVELILWDQGVLNIEESRINDLRRGAVSSYDFMLECIKNLEITPAQLALDPCCGAVVITDVNTGDVLAMVSYPSYDNNRLANSADTAYLARLNNDYSRPLWNYATQYRSAPGSTFKPVSAVAGLEEGVIDLDSIIYCTGTFDKLTGIQHKCWVYPGGHGGLNVSGGIAHSCNCFFYEVGYRLAKDENNVYDANLGTERLAKYAEWFGLTEKSGVEIPEADPIVSGVYPVPSAIGQGEHAYTTVGLARYVTAIATNGTVYDLTLLDKVVDSKGKVVLENHADIRNHVDLPVEYWNAIHSGMKRVVEAKTYFHELPVTAAGKTGTAQESKKRANHGLFIGYAPYESPQIAMNIRIMNGYSSDYAAQVAKDILAYYYDLKNRDELITGQADTPVAAQGGD
ncbi:MAG: penicillin-binding protein [Lachnospiraceae bacterium]|nr:penicillin-binding protein [Lachnospiraceae bacterium]